MFKSLSTSLIARGILAVIIGIIALAWPSVTVLALVILFAVYAFMASGMQAARAFSSRTRRAGHRAPAARPGRPGRRGDRAGLAGAHRAGAGADRGRVGGHRRPGRVLRRLRLRRAGRDPGHVHPGRAGHHRVRRGAVRPPRPRRDHPRAAVRPVQPDRRDLDARAGHRAAPHRQDPALGQAGNSRKRRRPEPCPDNRNHARSAQAPRAAR